MYVEELDLYKVACHVTRSDLHHYGITLDDLVQRTPLGHLFFKKASELSKQGTSYQWPGCGFSMQIDFYPDEVILTFSERIEDFLYNLEQSRHALSAEQAEELERMILMIRMAEEPEARQIIKRFEESVREL